MDFLTTSFDPNHGATLLVFYLGGVSMLPTP